MFLDRRLFAAEQQRCSVGWFTKRVTMLIRAATLRDLPAIIALVAHEDEVVDPATVRPGDDYVKAFLAVDDDPRNEMLVLEDTDEAVIGYLQITYIPGLGRGGRERALMEAIRVRPDRRERGRGHHLVRHAIERARDRGCGMVQLMSNKSRRDAHRFYTSLGFAKTHDGFKLDISR